MADPKEAYPTSGDEPTSSEAYPTSQQVSAQPLTDEQLQQKMEGLRQQALMEMQTNPHAVIQRLRARNATQEQIAGLFANVGIDLPTGPAPGQTALPVQQIQPASVQYGAGAYTTPSGQAVLPTQQIQPAYVQHGPGAYATPSGAVGFPTTPIVAGAPPMSDEDILKGGMYVQPQQGTVARKQ